MRLYRNQDVDLYNRTRQILEPVDFRLLLKVVDHNGGVMVRGLTWSVVDLGFRAPCESNYRIEKCHFLLLL